jgi:hypothetical protein
MTLTDAVVKRIIRRLLEGTDYRIEVVTLLNAEFLQFAIEFFKKVTDAKFHSKPITKNWYKENFLKPTLPAKEIAINSGLNGKTIRNMYKSQKKEVIIDASSDHYDTLLQSIEELIETQNDLDLNLTIKFNGVSVDLNVSECLIVINTLAVKRSELRGGAWATAGKRVEKLLMRTLCELYSVDAEHYRADFKRDHSKEVNREVDFYLLSNGKEYRCEVKLMGKGNPESADAAFARSPDIFIGDSLSQQNKNQFNQMKILWVELRSTDGFRKFKTILETLDIPHVDYQDSLEQNLSKIFKLIF